MRKIDPNVRGNLFSILSNQNICHSRSLNFRVHKSPLKTKNLSLCSTSVPQMKVFYPLFKNNDTAFYLSREVSYRAHDKNLCSAS